MLADSAVYSTSPWKHEQLFSNFDLDVSALEAELEVVRRETDNLHVEPVRSKGTLRTSTTSSSIAGSDCSDEAFLELDMDSTFLNSSMGDEYLGNSLLGMMDVPESSDIGGFDWSDSDLESHVSGFFQDLATEHGSDYNYSATSSPCAKRKKQCDEEWDNGSKEWKGMSSSEQLSAVERLTRVISCEMGLREQLEVIRIINPQANVSPMDTEFVIELDRLNDEKLQKVQDYVNNHMCQHHSDNEHSNTSSPQRRKKGYRSSTSSSCSSSSSSSCCGESGSECSSQKKLTKKQKAQLKAQQQKEARQRQRKEYRQMQKEKKSGLFRKEEVLALAGCDHDNGVDEDIDILD